MNWARESVRKIVPHYELNYLLIALIPHSRSAVRKGIMNRHNWIHHTTYQYSSKARGKSEVISDAVYYSTNLYINLVSEKKFDRKILHKAVWFEVSYNEIFPPPLYFWNLRSSIQRAKYLQLRIALNPPCGTVFNGNISSSGVTVNTLEGLVNRGIQIQCQYLFFMGYLSDGFARLDGDTHYCGPPIQLSSLSYPADPLEQLKYESATFFILVDSLPNATILSIPSMDKVPSIARKYMSVFNFNIKRVTDMGWVKDFHTDLGFGGAIYLFAEVREPKFKSSTSSLFSTRTSDFRFMTCQPRQVSIDFQVYLKPFGTGVWLCLVLIIYLSKVFLWLLFRFNGGNDGGLILLYSYLLEHAYRLSFKLQHLKTFNIFLSMFLMASIVLSNAYKGIVITDITAPLQESHISTFQEAVDANYTLIVRLPSSSNIIIGRYIELIYYCVIFK